MVHLRAACYPVCLAFSRNWSWEEELQHHMFAQMAAICRSERLLTNDDISRAFLTVLIQGCLCLWCRGSDGSRRALTEMLMPRSYSEYDVTVGLNYEKGCGYSKADFPVQLLAPVWPGDAGVASLQCVWHSKRHGVDSGHLGPVEPLSLRVPAEEPCRLAPVPCGPCRRRHSGTEGLMMLAGPQNLSFRKFLWFC